MMTFKESANHKKVSFLFCNFPSLGFQLKQATSVPLINNPIYSNLLNIIQCCNSEFKDLAFSVKVLIKVF